jgi:putative endopeptidase
MKPFILSIAAVCVAFISFTQKSTINVNYMDKGVKATEDFFLFSNGEWIKNNEIPASESRWGSFNELDRSNKDKITRLLMECEKEALSNPPGSDNQLLGDFYHSFLDMKSRNAKGHSQIESQLKKIIAISSFTDVVSIIAKLHNQGVSSLFGIYVGQDMKNIEKNQYHIYQSGIGLPNMEYYTSDKKRDILNAYELYIQNSHIAIYKDENKAQIFADNIIRFETALAKTMFKPAEMRIPENTYNKKTIEEITKMVHPFDINLYIKERELNQFDTSIVGTLKFMENIPSMMTTFNIDEWKDYLKWNVIRSSSAYLDQEFIDLQFDFYGKTLRGKKELKSIQDRAIEEITSSEIAEIMGKVFVAKHFSKEAKKKVNEMVDNLLIVFQGRINNLEWMSGTTKKEALTKLNAIGRKLGYPDEWKDMSSLVIDREDYFNNILALNVYSVSENLNKIDKPVDKNEWGMPAHMVNAYYHPLLNEIAFPAGIMQPPFFDENAEDAVNYGGIGMVIGHEFTHGFDDMGSKFAADGSFKNWWTEEDRKLFEEKTKVLGETYAQFCPISDNCVNPELTMGENIADLGGLTMAFHAYKMTDEYKSGKALNGFSPAQRFFISYAQLWKIKYTDEEMKNRIANDSHSPGMYRVNGPLMNCPEFFEAFEVKESDPMRNEELKVSKIW